MGPGNKLKSEHLLLSAFLLSVFVLAIIRVTDTDTWMHLSLGRIIWQLKGLPVTEPYVYTASGSPFAYSSWLFGLVYYLAYLAFNFYGVVLLKALTVTAVIWILIRDALRPFRNLVVSLAVMLVMVMLLRQRFVERPDTFMMVFLSFSVFSLNAYVYDNKKYLYLLPVVHFLWANCHSSINLMVVPFGAFIVGGMVQRYFQGSGVHSPATPSPSQIRMMLVIMVASFAASLINPYFIGQYFFGAKILAIPWYKQEIMELQAPTWGLTKWPYLLTLAVILSFAVNRKRFSLVHFLLVFPFVALSFTSNRFIFVLGTIAGPVLARNLSSFLDQQSWGRIFLSKRAIAFSVIMVLIYPLLFISQEAPLARRDEKFGFGADFEPLPEKALQYMDKRGIYGRIFQTFEWGGYINWRDFPRRSVFIDPRGELPVSLLEKTRIVLTKNGVMDSLAEQYGLKAVLIKYPQSASKGKNGSDFVPFFSNPRWALVYWDDISLLYLKRGDLYDSVIETDEYQLVRPADTIRESISRLHDDRDMQKMIEELKRNIRETHSSRGYYYLSLLDIEAGHYRDAIAAAEEVLKLLGEDSTEAYNVMARAYFRLGNLDESIRFYKKSFALIEDASVSYNIGVNYAAKGDRKNALLYLTKALGLNENLLSVYPVMIRLYQEESGDPVAMDRILKRYERARTRNEGEVHFRKGMEAYMAKRFEEAAEEFRKSLEVSPQSPVAYSNLGYVYFDMKMIDRAFEYQRKALEVDPNYANAHYGLALIYKDRGALVSARRHWEEYLRIEPQGYFSRRAAEQIKGLENTH